MKQTSACLICGKLHSRGIGIHTCSHRCSVEYKKRYVRRYMKQYHKSASELIKKNKEEFRLLLKKT